MDIVEIVTDEMVETACEAYNTVEDAAWEPAMRAALLAVLPALVMAERKREREECAKIADDEDGEFTWSGMDRNVIVGQRVASEIAAAIDAIGAKP